VLTDGGHERSLHRVVRRAAERDREDKNKADNPGPERREEEEERVGSVIFDIWHDASPDRKQAGHAHERKKDEHDDRRAGASPPEVLVRLGRERPLPVSGKEVVCDRLVLKTNNGRRVPHC
jgi:hypothetical protein